MLQENFTVAYRPAQLFPDDGLIKRTSINIDKFVHKF